MGRSPKAALVLWCVFVLALGGGAVAGCNEATDLTPSNEETRPLVLAGTGFLSDIAQNVAGSRLNVTSLLQAGTDPHSFEPTPRDVRMVAQSRAVIINSWGFEPVIDSLIESVGRPDLLVIQAAAGLRERVPRAGEAQSRADDQEPGDAADEFDSHFWLNPLNVAVYVANIEKGLVATDPAGAETYAQNAEVYTQLLRELDTWVAARVTEIPVARRLLVTNHESLGYFADRYGFEVVGAVFPTLGTEGTPSAKQLVALIEAIRTTGAPAVFLEAGSNPDIARQVARETGVEVVTGLYTHSFGGQVSTYLDMMRWNVNLIVEALR